MDTMNAVGPATVMCTYRVQAGKEAFMKLLSRHWRPLHRLGLATDDRPLVFKGMDPGNKPYFVEIFVWRDGNAPNTAHMNPEVMAVWEPMGALVEERDGEKSIEFPHVQRVTVPFEQ